MEKLYTEAELEKAIRHFWPMGDDAGVKKYIESIPSVQALSVPSEMELDTIWCNGAGGKRDDNAHIRGIRAIHAHLLSIGYMNRSEVSDYVAWLRWNGSTYVTCDSDAQGAFKVYRGATQSPSNGKTVRDRLNDPWQESGPGTGICCATCENKGRVASFGGCFHCSLGIMLEKKCLTSRYSLWANGEAKS
jgi:hypothetical protein